MRYTHPIDRIMLRARTTIVVLAVLSLPVFLVSYGLMMKHAVTTYPVWIAVSVFVSHAIGWLGIASLIDMTRERDQ
jgi:hypothetical protein